MKVNSSKIAYQLPCNETTHSEETLEQDLFTLSRSFSRELENATS